MSINFDLIFFLEIKNCEIEKKRDNQRKKFPKIDIINEIDNTTFFVISEITIRHTRNLVIFMYYFFGRVAFKINANNPAGIKPVVNSSFNLIPKSGI